MPENPSDVSRGLTSRILKCMAFGRASSLRRDFFKHQQNNVSRNPRTGETWIAEESLTLLFSTGKGSEASKMHRGVTGTNGMIPIAHSRYRSTQQHLFRASGSRTWDILAACTRILTFTTHSDACACLTRFPSSTVSRRASQMSPHVISVAYCRMTVLTSVHTLDTRRESKPHHTRCAISHKTAATTNST